MWSIWLLKSFLYGSDVETDTHIADDESGATQAQMIRGTSEYNHLYLLDSIEARGVYQYCQRICPKWSCLSTYCGGLDWITRASKNSWALPSFNQIIGTNGALFDVLPYMDRLLDHLEEVKKRYLTSNPTSEHLITAINLAWMKLNVTGRRW